MFGAIVCQSCLTPIAYFENDKVTKLYAKEEQCTKCKKEHKGE
mgnify:CR=1 FL=1